MQSASGETTEALCIKNNCRALGFRLQHDTIRYDTNLKYLTLTKKLTRDQLYIVYCTRPDHKINPLTPTVCIWVHL